MGVKMKLCSVEGCEKTAKGRGFCSAHYMSIYRASVLKSCSIDDCPNKENTGGLCPKHYKRLQTHGDVTVVKTFGPRNKTVKAIEWLEDAIASAHPDQCCEWPFQRDPKGYPRLGGYPRATHAALILFGIAQPSPNHWVLHSCDNPPCVNPHHLRWGTCQDNMNDMHARGRDNIGIGPKTLRKFSDEDVRTIRKRLDAIPEGAPKWSAPGYDSVRKIANDYGVPHSRISNIKLGKCYADVVESITLPETPDILSWLPKRRAS